MMDNGYFQKIEDEFLAGTYQKIPVLAARAQGANIWDLDGKEYLDLMSGYGVAILGHSDEKIKEAIMQQMEKVYITHASVYSPARAEFLKDFMSIAPRGLNRAFLSNSGTEAVEAAIKIAVKSTRRHRMISISASPNFTNSTSPTRRSWNDFLYFEECVTESDPSVFPWYPLSMLIILCLLVDFTAIFIAASTASVPLLERKARLSPLGAIDMKSFRNSALAGL